MAFSVARTLNEVAVAPKLSKRDFAITRQSVLEAAVRENGCEAIARWNRYHWGRHGW